MSSQKILLNYTEKIFRGMGRNPQRVAQYQVSIIVQPISLVTSVHTQQYLFNKILSLHLHVFIHKNIPHAGTL